MRPVQRTWLVVAGIAAAAATASLLVTAAVGRARPAAARPPPLSLSLRIARLDAHQHVAASALDQAAQLAASHGFRGLANLSGGWLGNGLEDQLAAASRHAGRVRVLMNLDASGCCGEGWAAREADRVARGRAAGAAGLDIPGAVLAGAPLDGPALAPVLDACQSLRLPVSVHLPGAEERAALERLAAARPSLRLLAAHLGGPGAGAAEMARMLGRLPNLHLDLSARLADLSASPDAARALFLAHPDRLLLGTNVRVEGDPPDRVMIVGAGRTAEEVRAFFLAHVRFLETRDPAIPLPGAGEVAGLGLPREVLEQVYHRNAERLLGFAPEAP